MSETPPPPAPDGSALSPEEWDAVRRLRGERSDQAEPPAAATAAPLPPVQPAPPPEQTAPPVEHSVRPVEPPSATVEQAGAEPAGAEPSAPTWGGGGSRRRARRSAEPAARAVPALTALVVLAVVAAVLASLVGLKVSDRQARDRASTAALAAATTGAATVLSYNYRSLDADFAKAEALLTPAFRKRYESTTAKAVQPLAAKYKAVSTAQVSAAGVITSSAGRARILVFVSQQVTNSQLSAPRLDRSRIQVDLVHRGGRWLIDNLTPI